MQLFKDKILMCKPNFYNIEYEINPWMNKNKKANIKEAQKQWQYLHHLIIRIGGFVEYVDPIKNLPDMVFTANAGLILSHDKTVILSKFHHKQRRGEEHYFREWFKKEGYEVIEYPGYFEGAGDALYAEKSNVLFVGHGFRSDKKVYQEYIGPYLKKHRQGLIYCELVDPRFYHLDTCFCPLPGNRAILYPGAFKDPSSITKLMDAFSVPENEAVRFACNSVCIGNSVILPEGCPETKTNLESWGFRVLEAKMDEFIKAGGASKCLTLKL